MEIYYDQSINDTIKKEVKKRIESVRDLFPGWCKRVQVMYSMENPEGFVVSCSPVYQYRFVQINIYQEFFQDISWEHSLIHEIQHSILTPFSSKLDSVIRHYVNDPVALEYIREDLRDAEEAVVEDLATLAMKLRHRNG